MDESIRSLGPIVDGRTAVLVLGSIPGRRSLDAGQYYANPQNSFWKIVHGLFGTEPHPDYRQRVAFLLEKKIGLWDTIKECSRDGSLDMKIRNAVPNDLGAMLAAYPGIRCVFFNGTKAQKVFDAAVRLDPGLRERVRFELLPSTSPANTCLNLEGKVERWQAVRRCLQATCQDAPVRR